MQFVIFALHASSFDSDGREIFTCYTYKTVAEYRPNIKQLQILLDPSNNSACAIFPAGVNINVTIGSVDFATIVPAPNYPPYSYTINNFGYSNTSVLIIEGFSLPDDGTGTGDEISIDYLLIEVYSYAEITRLEIMELQTIISSLSECFYAAMPVTLTQTFLTIQMNATGLCRIQIASLASLHITIDGNAYSFDMTNLPLQDLAANYAHNKLFSVKLTPPGTTPLAYTTLKPNWDASGYLLTTSGGVETRIDLQFSSVKYTSIAGFYSLSFMALNDGQFAFTTMPILAKVYQLSLTMAQTGRSYNNMIFRFQVTANGQTRTFDYRGLKYNIYITKFLFACADMPSNEQDECVKFYKLVQESDSVGVTCSGLFYANDTLIGAQHDTIPYRRQQWERTLFITEDDKTCLHLESSNPKVAFDPAVQTTFNISISKKINATAHGVNGTFVFSTSYNNQEKVCFSNSTLQDLIETDYLATLVVTQGTNTFYNLFWGMKAGDTKKNALTAYVILGVGCFAAAVYSLSGFVRFQKQLKAMKKKKTV
ncbi:Conserved_hypothetical protein [Hexamita inflata]|uniref:Transmembrane protein n=1 Tax=Hexamita inflata TaxID=28002 RepID=A0AA86TGL2_9EUKA|nr:Conserved hypothetical protein [Hexamita inflata]CAI9965055.1 Conserved hypothetical protein [Hexamita inflata]